MRKRVLLIGMLDSIHVGRWLEQFSDESIDFFLFPSKKFRYIHPKIRKLINSNLVMNVRLVDGNWVSSFYGYFDFVTRVLPKSYLSIDFRLISLKLTLRFRKYEFVHCLEIQGAGYLISDSLNVNNDFKVIVTNWGSDIYYFKNIPEHLARIRRVLKCADYYSAECFRDYKLARELGFDGVELPCIPNAGGFSLAKFDEVLTPSKRRQIVIKTYGSTFGRGDLAIKVVKDSLFDFSDIHAFFYSVTDDLISDVQSLSQAFPGRVKFSKQSEPIPSHELRKIFLDSRVYVGCSISDGISTSFLEALVTGAFPIQTNTSCADEWLLKGARGSIVSLDREAIGAALVEALSSDALVDSAAQANLIVASNYLDFETVKRSAITFYQG